jgi:hypothetical protein
MSEVKVNKISPRTNCGTVTLGDSGDTFTIPAGVTLTNSGTATGFGPTGAVSWDTTAVTSSPLTAASGVGYFINTSGGAITVNLPAGSAGAIISLADYTNTWQTNNVTVNANGSEKIGGIAAPAILDTEGQSVTFLYVDATEGWKNIQDSTSNVTGNPFIVATGGTILTCGDFKTHVFTGPGTFTVTNAGQPSGSTSVEYLVVAGGGGGGASGGGGGAGGYRQNYPSPTTTGIPVTAQSYPITVGSGGAGSPGPSAPCSPRGIQGNSSVFSTITSTGGGGGGSASEPPAGPTKIIGGSGGSGGGGSYNAPGDGTIYPGGAGNTPPTSPSQGNNGGQGQHVGPSFDARGGGGGAGAVGQNGGPGLAAGNGGVGSPIATAFFGPTSPSYGTPGPAPGRYFAGGGAATGSPGQGGAGGGGSTPANSGTVNTGGGGASSGPTGVGASGGSGIVVIRYKFQ